MPRRDIKCLITKAYFETRIVLEFDHAKL